MKCKSCHKSFTPKRKDQVVCPKEECRMKQRKVHNARSNAKRARRYLEGY